MGMTDVATICPPLRGNASGASAQPGTPTAAMGRRGTMGLATQTDTTDEQFLIEKAQGGDMRAFEQLYRRNASRVYALCLRMCGEPGYAEEMTQEAFIRAWQRLASFRGDARLSTWLHRVTVNVVLSDRRSRARRMDQVTDPLETQEMRLASRPDAPGLSVDLEEAIARLPEGAREVFILHDIEGYKHKEIGEMTGIATGTSKAHLHRARRLLREQLDR
jgi:RNA polymerase sigma-70 factor, ECF subfamily